MSRAVKIFVFGGLFLILSLTATGNVPLWNENPAASQLSWKKRVIQIAFSNSFLRPHPGIRPESDVLGALERSLKAWEAVADIEFQVVLTEKQNISPAGKTGDGVNLITIAQTAENLAVFNNGEDDVSARTRVFFDRRGIISEADIVLNPYQQFSTDGAIGTFDLEATLTHEIGHLLGLRHSLVWGATMNELQLKNGVYGIANFAWRTLSEDDIASIRAIYGAKIGDENCCGSLAGKVSLPNGKPAKNVFVWLEEKESGRVLTGKITNGEGFFQLDGLPANKYQIFAQSNVADSSFIAEKLGEIEVSQGKTASFEGQAKSFARMMNASHIGFNGQLARSAVPLNGGKSYLIYFAGKFSDYEGLRIGFNSFFLSLPTGQFSSPDFGFSLTVTSVEINVADKTQTGEYTVFLQNDRGEKTYLVGALTIEEFVNPWIIFNLR